MEYFTCRRPCHEGKELLKPSRRPVRLKVANGEIMGGDTHEATISMEFWEHERLNRPDQAKRSTLSGNFYVADITDWDMIMGYDFMVANAIGALPHRATLVGEDDECLTWLSTNYACGSSQWNAEEEDRIVRAVQAVGAKSRGDRGVQLTEYGMAPQVYDRMIQTLGAKAPETDVFASRDAPLLRKCRRHWHRGDSAWHRHWGLKEWGPMYWHGSLDNTRRTVEKIIADRAKGILVITGIGSTPCPLEGLKSTLDSITLNEMSFGPEEELFIDAKGVSMPSPGQAWGTKAFLVDGAQAQPTGDEAFIRRVEAVPMKVMFEPKEGTDQPIDGIDVLSHAKIDDVVNYMRMGMHDRVAAKKRRAMVTSPHVTVCNRCCTAHRGINRPPPIRKEAVCTGDLVSFPKSIGTRSTCSVVFFPLFLSLAAETTLVVWCVSQAKICLPCIGPKWTSREEAGG